MPGSRVDPTAVRGRRTGRLAAAAVLALAVTGGVVYAGTRPPSETGPDQSSRQPTATSTPTPLENLDLSQLPIERGPFCDRLDEGDVETALGGPVTDTTHYDSGDRVELDPGVTDVSHEYSCSFTSEGGAEARAWVFAAPTSARAGTSIAGAARREKGCSPVRRAPAYGTPSVAMLCRTGDPAGSRVTLSGLFGDAWLSCRLSTPAPTGPSATVARAEQWCVRVATTLGARP